jgi:predicted CoA-binding protein
LGVVNPLAADVAREAGLQVVMDRCMKVEHQRLLG